VSGQVVEHDHIACREGWRQHLLDMARKISPLIGPSTTNGAMTPLSRRPATKVVVSQCPCGTASTTRCPRGALP
jgi:hypothetical protein